MRIDHLPIIILNTSGLVSLVELVLREHGGLKNIITIITVRNEVAAR